MRVTRSLFVLVLVFAAGYVMGQFSRADLAAQAGGQKVFELRTYYTLPGKLPDLQTRFRDHTTKIFEKHGMKSVGYWVPQDGAEHTNTLVYIISHDSREQAKKNWAEFGKDPEWVKVKTASEANGKIVEKVDSVYMDPADFSQIK